MLSLLQSCTGFLRALSRGPQGQVCGCFWFISGEKLRQSPLHCTPHPTVQPTAPSACSGEGWAEITGGEGGLKRVKRRWNAGREHNLIWHSALHYGWLTHAQPATRNRKHKPLGLPACLSPSPPASYILGLPSFFFSFLSLSSSAPISPLSLLMKVSVKDVHWLEFCWWIICSPFFLPMVLSLLGHCKETLFHLVCWGLVVADCFLPPQERSAWNTSSEPWILTRTHLTSHCRALISQSLQRLLPCATAVNWCSILGVYLNAEHINLKLLILENVPFYVCIYSCLSFIKCHLVNIVFKCFCWLQGFDQFGLNELALLTLLSPCSSLHRQPCHDALATPFMWTSITARSRDDIFPRR